MNMYRRKESTIYHCGEMTAQREERLIRVNKKIDLLTCTLEDVRRISQGDHFNKSLDK